MCDCGENTYFLCTCFPPEPQYCDCWGPIPAPAAQGTLGVGHIATTDVPEEDVVVIETSEATAFPAIPHSSETKSPDPGADTVRSSRPLLDVDHDHLALNVAEKGNRHAAHSAGSW